MILAWMLYGSLIAAFVALGALAAERVARIVGYPVRWVWTGAIALTIVLVASAPLRRDAATTVSVVTAPRSIVAPPSIVADRTWVGRIAARARSGRDALDGSLDAVATALASARYRVSNRAAAALWLGCTSMLIIVAIGGQRRATRARRRWPIADLQGARVRVSPSTGPAVVGVRRPEIIVPRWLFDKTAHEQSLIIAHEAEHVRAFDTLVLTAAGSTLALLPWCAALWYMFSRLRLAVEMDCDARVLRGGAAPQSYGSLLIDVAARCANEQLGVPALAAGRSHLQRRLIAMHDTLPRFAPARGALALTLCTLTLIAACEARLPTPTEVNRLDAVEAKTQAEKLGMLSKTDSLSYFVDGVAVSSEQARRLAPGDSIATINVSKANGVGKISVLRNRFRVRADSEKQDRELSRTESARRTGDSSGVGVAVQVLDRARTTQPKILDNALTKMLLFIDGQRVSEETFKAIDPKRIESVDVIKGAAAASTFGPDAVNGVISIKTKAKP